MHGLQHYTEVLIANGYDDVQFLGEVPDLELQEIGILDPTDRQRVNKLILYFFLKSNQHKDKISSPNINFRDKYSTF